jgi:competence protein ComEC
MKSADLRLYSLAGGTWAASLGCLYSGPRTALWTAGVAASLAIVVGLLLRGRGSNRWTAIGWALIGLLLGLVCGALATAARTAARDAEPLAGLARAHAQVRAEFAVTGDPWALRRSGPGPATYGIPAELSRLDVEGLGTVRLDARVLVFATDPGWQSLLPGHRVGATATLAPARGGDLTAAVLNIGGGPEILDSPPWTQTVAGRLRAGLQTACRPLAADVGGLLPGLVIGDTSRLDPALAEDFRTTGLTHLVAVSGANVAIVVGVVAFLARWCRAGPWLTAVIAGLALVGFVILARPSASVIRAAAMGAIALLALALGRPAAASSALAAAVVLGLVADPALAVDAGFALSVVATGALVLLAPRWRDALRARGVPSGLSEAIAVPAAAQVACGPIIVALSGQVSLVAVPANLLAAPAVAPATLLGVGSAVLSVIWPAGAGMLAWLASWPARWLVIIATTGAAIPAGAIPWPAGPAGAIGLALLTAALLFGARWPPARRLLLVGAVAVAAGAVPIRWVAPGWPPTGALMVACDVGQGDALVLPVDGGQAVVVDAGPEPIAVDRCLRRLGISAVPTVVLTHFHADHIAGLAGVLRGRSVGAVVVPSFAEPAAGAQAVRDQALAAGVGVSEAGVGWTLHRGQLDLVAIGPTHQLTGTRSDPNNNSIVIRAVSHGVSILLSADAETEEQHELLSDVDSSRLRADVLKVAHHGSVYQDPALLDLVRPRVAVVSVGADNPYGHPNLALLSRLTRSGARVMRTDRDGDVAVVRGSDGGLGVAASAPSDPRQALLQTRDHPFVAVGFGGLAVRRCPHDPPRCPAPRRRRRGVVGGARGGGGGGRGSGHRSGRGHRGVRRRRDDPG